MRVAVRLSVVGRSVIRLHLSSVRLGGDGLSAIVGGLSFVDLNVGDVIPHFVEVDAHAVYGALLSLVIGDPIKRHCQPHDDRHFVLGLSGSPILVGLVV